MLTINHDAPNPTIYQQIQVDKTQPLPDIVLALSPCRSGSTALFRVVGEAGTPAYYQPLKTIVRWQLVSKVFEWRLPQHHPVIYIKETLGPYSHAESTLDPLEQLLEAGIPQSNIRLLLCGRRPEQVWASWQYWWGQQTSIDLLGQAFETCERIRVEADQLGIQCVTWLYEKFALGSPETILPQLLASIALPFNRSALSWSSLPFPQTRGILTYFDSPPHFVDDKMLAELECARYFQYRPPRKIEDRSLHNSTEMQKMNAIYAHWQRLCDHCFPTLK